MARKTGVVRSVLLGAAVFGYVTLLVALLLLIERTRLARA